MPRILTVEDLEILNDLVQDGLIEVVSIDAGGEPSYQIASRLVHAGRYYELCRYGNVITYARSKLFKRQPVGRYSSST